MSKKQSKKHYYSFVFSYSEGTLITTASVYIGYPKKFVSIPQILSAKKQAGVHADAVMLSCCYLGKLTQEEMKTGIKRSILEELINILKEIIRWVKIK